MCLRSHWDEPSEAHVTTHRAQMHEHPPPSDARAASGSSRTRLQPPGEPPVTGGPPLRWAKPTDPLDASDLARGKQDTIIILAHPEGMSDRRRRIVRADPQHARQVGSGETNRPA